MLVACIVTGVVGIAVLLISIMGCNNRDRYFDRDE
jgi:hypothetical protein